MNLGFVGLGAMGSLIVPRLMVAGHTVTGWNRSRDKAADLIAAGMRWADTPRGVAEASDIVFSIVADAKAVRACALGPDGIVAGLKKGGIYIDMSTIEPEESRAVAQEFAKAGSIMLDGPLSGSPVTVKAGQASIMVGGDFSDLPDDVQLVLYRVAQEALSNAARHSGAARVDVTLRRGPEGVDLSVADDGRGFAFAESERGLGIGGMRERALLVDGELTIESRPEAGTTVRLHIPG